ncbi:MAG: SynChlorMet cassette protein ScmD [Deltaproteobacteria bacterium]|nr:SynChlorMet cassette protein ScmD [Deltaproteobacteria bacterium]
MPEDMRPVANPSVVLREEFDDWAILFDPDSNVTLGINPMGVQVWKYLDGKHSVGQILNELRERCEDVPREAETHVREFVDDLLRRGLVRSDSW